MKNSPLINAFKNSKTVAVIGIKGVPPEFSGTSGVEFYVTPRLSLLAEAGIKVVCYVRNWATPRHIKTYNGASLIHLPSIPTLYLDAVSHSLFATIHACFSPVDTVWYQAAGPAMFSFLPRLFGKKVVVTLHTFEWRRKKWEGAAQAILILAERIAVNSAHEALVVSQGLAGYYAQSYGRSCHIDLPMTPPQRRPSPKIILHKYGLGKGQFILYLGRFVPEKRIEWLIRAFRKLPHSGLRLVLAGGAHHMDGYAASLRALAHNDKRIQFVGWIFGKEKEELLANCRLFVLPSSLEGNPTVLYELPSDRTAIISDEVAKSVVHRNNLVIFSGDHEQDFIKKLRKSIIDAKMNHP